MKITYKKLDRTFCCLPGDEFRLSVNNELVATKKFNNCTTISSYLYIDSELFKGYIVGDDNLLEAFTSNLKPGTYTIVD